MEYDETATNLMHVASELKILVPIGENILIQVGELDTAIALKKAGLIVPDMQKDKPNNGIIYICCSFNGISRCWCIKYLLIYLGTAILRY